MKREYWYGLMFAFIVLIGLMTYDFYLTHKLIKQTRTDIVEVRDTIKKISYDTIFVDRPIAYKVKEIKHDTVRITDVKHDSVDVILPVIQKEYRDSTYSAWVSGYQDVNLDSIEIYQKNIFTEINNTKYVTKYKNRPFGFSVGLGGTYSPVSNKIEPGVFLGITYTIKSFGKR